MAFTLKGYLKELTDFQRTMPGRKPVLYASMEEFVLKQGIDFTPRTLPVDIVRGAMNECYSNAWNLLLEHEDLVYCEGYGISKGLIPVVHAWCVTEDGFVVDPTWEAENAEYFGVPFSRDYAIRTVMSKEYHGLIDDWRNGWPLLAGEHTDFRHEVFA